MQSMESFIECISCCQPISLPQLLEQNNDQKLQSLGVYFVKSQTHYLVFDFCYSQVILQHECLGNETLLESKRYYINWIK